MTTAKTLRDRMRTIARAVAPLAAAAMVSGFSMIGGNAAQAATTTGTVSFRAVDDAYSSSARPTSNTGKATKLVAGSYRGDTMVTYLKFTVDALPAGAKLKKAEVVLTGTGSSLPQAVTLSPVPSTSWSEKTLTGKNRPSMRGVIATAQPQRDAERVSLDVTGAVTGAGTYSFAVKSTEKDVPARFHSDEAGSGRPVLTVTVSTTTPDPKPAPAPAPVTPADGTVVVRPVADAYTSSARPTYNTGDSDKLVTGTYSGDTMVSYLKFTVAALPAGAEIAKARIVLTSTGSSLPETVTLSPVPSTGWAEETLTNANRPSMGDVIATVHPGADARQVFFDVTGAVTAGGTYSFAVKSPVAEGPARFRSDESGGSEPQLQLTLATAVPAPAPQPEPAPEPVPVPQVPTTCTVDAKLVPSCNILWGAAAGGFSTTPRDEALRIWEKKTGRTASIYHTYHRGDELFPTKSEIAMANEPGKPRLLMTNWKVAQGTTWAKVAAGTQDARIDRLSAFINKTYHDPFYLIIHHEPENDVNPTAGSGMTAKDYAAMYRHTVERMRANGVDNAVFMVSYMGIEKFYNQPWWYDLYPGDDVVDWIGLDAYVASKPGGYHYGTLSDLLNRTTDRKKFPGFYNWVTTQHPDKPFMLSEWGVHEYTEDPAQKAKTLSSVLSELNNFPAVKGMVWFDTESDQNGSDIRIDSSAAALTEFQKIAMDPRFEVQVR